MYSNNVRRRRCSVASERTRLWKTKRSVKRGKEYVRKEGKRKRKRIKIGGFNLCKFCSKFKKNKNKNIISIKSLKDIKTR